MSEASKSLSLLREAVDRIAKELGIERIQFYFTPAEETDNDTVSLVFRIPPEALMSPEELEQKRIDDAFSGIAAGFEDKTEDKIEQVKKDLEQNLNDWFNED